MSHTTDTPSCRAAAVLQLVTRICGAAAMLGLAALAGCSMQTVRAMKDARYTTGYADSVALLIQSKANQTAISGKLGSTVLRLEVERNGALDGVSVVQGSGSDAQDQQAIAIVTGLGDLPPPPSQVMPGQGRVPLDIAVSLFQMPWPPRPANPFLSAAQPGVPAAITPAQYAYFNAVDALIAKDLRYPEPARLALQEGNATVAITTSLDGTILGTALVRSSGHALLDAESLLVFSRIGKLPPVPDTMPAGVDKIEFRLPILFRLH